MDPRSKSSLQRLAAEGAAKRGAWLPLSKTTPMTTQHRKGTKNLKAQIWQFALNSTKGTEGDADATTVDLGQRSAKVPDPLYKIFLHFSYCALKHIEVREAREPTTPKTKAAKPCTSVDNQIEGLQGLRLGFLYSSIEQTRGRLRFWTSEAVCHRVSHAYMRG